VAARAELLKSDIERTKQDLAEHLGELKVEATAAERKLTKLAGAALAGFVLYKAARFLWNRARH
jgi:hypothetical protein